MLAKDKYVLYNYIMLLLNDQGEKLYNFKYFDGRGSKKKLFCGLKNFFEINTKHSKERWKSGAGFACMCATGFEGP